MADFKEFTSSCNEFESFSRPSFVNKSSVDPTVVIAGS